MKPHHWRDGRADEGACLENRYALKRIVGSNPTPSANRHTQWHPYATTAP